MTKPIETTKISVKITGPNRPRTTRSGAALKSLLTVSALALTGLVGPLFTPSAFAQNATIKLYETDNLSGRSLLIDRDIADLTRYDFNDRVGSIEIPEGRWLMCEHVNYQGRCEVVDTRNCDLRALKLQYQVSSIAVYREPVGQRFERADDRAPDYRGPDYRAPDYRRPDYRGFRISAAELSPPIASGLSSAYFLEPRFRATPIHVCLDPGARLCGQATADQFCRIKGFAKAAFFASDYRRIPSVFLATAERNRGRDEVFSEILCVR